MPSFLSLFQGDYKRAPRPTRFAKLLRSVGDVTICAFGGEQEARRDGMLFTSLARRPRTTSARIVRAASLLAHRYEDDIWNDSACAAFDVLQSKVFSCIICHDLVLLPLACALRDMPHNAGRCKVIMDAREFYPRQFEDRFVWRLFLGGLNGYLCQRYLPQSDRVFTVSPGLRRGYADEYGVQCAVLPSYSFYATIEPHATATSVVRCIHHGMASPGRKLEVMIEAIRFLGGRFHLDFMLMPSTPHYLNALKKQAADTPYVTFRDPVPMPEIVQTISEYDMGLFLLRPNTFNHRHFLPNKLFEFIQARLAVAVGPSPDMAYTVRAHGVGVVSEDFTPQSFAAILNNLRPEDIDAFKGKAHIAAGELCWERNDEVIARTLHELLV